MAVRILIVDDHDVVRQGVRSILRGRSGWEVCGEADNGFEALKKVAELAPDVVILDISMPGMDGLGVAKELASRKALSKILVLTMHDSPGAASAIWKAGAHGYVVKSHAAQHLVHAIDAILDGGAFVAIEPTQAGGIPQVLPDAAGARTE